MLVRSKTPDCGCFTVDKEKMHESCSVLAQGAMEGLLFTTSLTGLCPKSIPYMMDILMIVVLTAKMANMEGNEQVGSGSDDALAKTEALLVGLEDNLRTELRAMYAEQARQVAARGTGGSSACH